ncbi:MAG: hypothetical protein ACOYM8_12905 [Caulobacterales bacterium]
MTFADHHAALSAADLLPSVDAAVQSVFRRAQSAFVYAWFDYELTSLAQWQACAALEMQLRRHFAGPKGRPRGLRQLFARAIESGALDSFTPGAEGGPFDRTRLDQVALALSAIRNDGAHGADTVVTPSMALSLLTICARLINHLAARQDAPS